MLDLLDFVPPGLTRGPASLLNAGRAAGPRITSGVTKMNKVN